MKKQFSMKRTMDIGVTYLILLAVAFVFFFPCLWLILASFSASGSIYSFEGFFPSAYSLATFQKLFTDTALYNYPKWFLNTLYIAAGSCVIGTFLTILTAYTMSRFEFRMRKPMMKTTMVLGMFPSFMSMTCSVSSYDPVWAYQSALGTDFDLCGRGAYGVSDPEGIF